MGSGAQRLDSRSRHSRRYQRKPLTRDDAREIMDKDGGFLCKNEVGKFRLDYIEDICFHSVLLVFPKSFSGKGAVWD